MSHLLRITDGTTTVTFSSGDMYLADYVPRSIPQDGVIQEQALIGFSGAMATNRSNVQSVNRLFVQAGNYARTRTGSRVYLEFDPDTSGTVYRSRLYAGIVEMTDDVLGNQWGSGTLELNLNWTREPFWEGPLTQIPLTNSSSTSTTDAVTVKNRNDASGENWVNLSATDVIGDIPAALKLEIANGTTDSDATDEMFIWHNVYHSPLTFDHFLEGEGSTDSTSTTDATSNAASYGGFSWALTTETKIAEWTLPSTDLTNAAGGRFSVLARWPAVFPYTDCWLRLTLETATTYNRLWTGDLVRVSPTTDADNRRQMHVLDTLRLPPYLEGQTGIKEIVLRLYGLRSSTDNTINIDYLQFSPISGDAGWKRFKSVGNGVGVGETLVHDDTEGYTYRQDSGGLKIAEFADYGGPILLVPNCNQRLYFNSCDYLGAAKITQNWNVKLWYRPRRSSL